MVRKENTYKNMLATFRYRYCTFTEFCTMIYLRKECLFQDWKYAMMKFLSSQANKIYSFRKQKKKKVFVRNKTEKSIFVHGEQICEFESSEPKVLTKKSKSFASSRIPEARKDFTLKSVKLNDVLS